MSYLTRSLLSRTPTLVGRVKTPLCVQTTRLLHTQLRVVNVSRSFAINDTTMYRLDKVIIRRYADASGEIYTEIVPSMGDSISEGTVAKWHKAVGDPIKVDDVVVSIETDKVNVDISAKVAGVLTEVLSSEGDVVPVGKEMFRINKGAVSDKKAEAPKTTEAPKTAEAPKASPPPKAEATSQAPPQKAPTPPAPTPATQAKPTSSAPSTGPREQRVKMTPMRRRIAERLKHSQNTAAMLTTFQECDMSALTELRSTFQEAFLKKHGVKLGFMSAFVKASVAALQDQPAVNGVIEGDYIVYRNFYDLSVAVATPRGLVVPVLRDCDKKSFADIEKELGVLGTKARNDQIAIEDMVGGTFTISNGGVYGSLMGTPIINPPQSAILGMHGITKRAIVVNDKIEIRPMMYLALTYDHRLIDGREAVTFLRKIKEIIEDPRRLLLDL